MVLHGTGDDLGGAGEAAVDQDNQRKTGEGAALGRDLALNPRPVATDEMLSGW